MVREARWFGHWRPDSRGRRLPRRRRLEIDELETRIVPTLLGTQLLPADNAWNQQITNAPVAANSAAIISNIGTAVELHPDFGQRYGNHTDLYGIPYNIVSGTQAKVPVVIDAYEDESDPIPDGVPIPVNAVIEGDWQDGPKAGLNNRGDSHLIVWDKDSNIAYELYRASRPSENGDNKWHADQVTVWDMAVNSFRTLGWTSADAAGLAILPGLARPDEGLPVAQGGQGVINHALRFTITNSKVLGQYIYPASHEANDGTNTSNMPPMGTRFRLKAGVDISSFNPQAKIIAQAMKDYGLILADNGSSMFFSGASAAVDASNNVWLTWDDDDIQDQTNGLKSLSAGDFEVVDLRPRVTGLSQSSAVAGTTITVIGQNFAGAAGRLTVFFGTTAVPGTYVNDTQVAAVVPSGSGTISITVRSGVVEAEDGNINDPIFGYGTSTTSTSFTFVNGPPNVQSIVRADTDPSNAGSVRFTVTFSQSVTGVDATDFEVVTASLGGVPAVTNVSGSGSVWTVTVSTGSGSGMLGINVSDNDTIVSSATGTPLGGPGGGNGNFSGPSYTIDRNSPSAPSTPDLADGSDTGDSNSDNLTNDTTPTFTGSAEAGSLVRIFRNGVQVGSGTAAAGDTYSITTSTLAAGGHNITATATDAAGNVSAVSGTLAITIDTTPPPAPSVPNLADASDSGSSSTDNLTNVTTPTFTGTAAAGATVTIRSNGTPVGFGNADAGGVYSILVAALTNGSHNITAVASDAAGNSSAASVALAITIDTTAPTAPSIPDLAAGSDSGPSSTDNITSDTTPTFTGSAITGSTVKIFSDGVEVGSAIAASSSYSITVSVLSQGAHSITATATDAAGNTSALSGALGITIDTSAPAVPSVPDLAAGSDTGDLDTDDLTSDTTPTFNGTAEPGSTVRIFSDGVQVGSGPAAGGSYSITTSALTGGSHNITATATDDAGNASDASAALPISIDTTPPAVASIVRADASPTTAASVAFTVTFTSDVTGVDASDFALTSGVSGAAVTGVSGGGTTWTVTVSTGSGDGTIRLDLSDDDTITDAAGNPLSGGFTGGQVYAIDRSGPGVQSIARVGGSASNGSSVQFTVTFTEAVSGVDAADFTLTVSGVSDASIADVSGGGTTWTVTVSTGSGDGSIRLDLGDDDSIIDLAGNVLGGPGAGNGGFAGGETFTIDKTFPTVTSIVRAGPSPTNALSVAFTVTFNDSVTGVDAADFALVTTGVVGASITSVSGSGTTRTVTVNTGTKSGSIRLDLSDNDTIADLAGNPLGGVGAGNGSFTPGQAYSIQKTKRPSAIGVYRGNGRWFVDANGDRGWNDPGFTFWIGSGSIAVAGDWDGDGDDEVGLYRNGLWVLDSNSNGVYEAGVDRRFRFHTHVTGDRPIVGDWNGNGITDVGIWRASNGRFVRDTNGDRRRTESWVSFDGKTGGLPVAGDWDGDGDDQVGIYRAGVFTLDRSSNGRYGAGDLRFRFGPSTGYLPVIGDWNNNRRDDVGLYRLNYFRWYLDRNANRKMDDGSYRYGGAKSDRPVVGGWPAPAPLHLAGPTGYGMGDELTEQSLQPIISEAIARFERDGISTEQAELLRRVRFVIRDLAGTHLGEASFGVVSLDRNAAGAGWFVDATPWADEEFTPASSGELAATASGPAFGKVDLLTVVRHELGHLLGLPDLDGVETLMAATLPAGVRR